MAVIAVEMLKEHRYQEDARGNTRILPHGWAGELDEEAAVVAIASGAARARGQLNAEQALAIAAVTAALDGDMERVTALMAEARAATASEAPADAATEPSVVPPASAPSARRKARG